MRRATAGLWVALAACGRLDFAPVPPIAAPNVFTAVAMPTGGAFDQIARAAGGTWYAATPGARVFHSSDDGATWIECTPPRLYLEHLYVDPASGAVYVGDDDDGILLASTDGCATWVDQGLPTFTGGIAMLGGDVLAGTSSGIARQHAGTWSVLSSPLDATHVGVVVVDQGGSRIFAGGAAGLARSLDGGASWTMVDNGFTNGLSVDYVSLDPSNASHVLAQAGQELFDSTDGGTTWTLSHWGGFGVAVDPGATSFVAYSSWTSGMITSTDGGATFGAPDLRTSAMHSAPIVDLEFGTSPELFAATNRGIFHASDHSLAWTERDGNVSAWTIDSITIDDLGDLVLGTRSGVLVSADRGATWTEHSQGMGLDSTTPSVTRLPGAPATLITATGGAIERTTDHGNTFTILYSIQLADNYHGNVVRPAGDHLVVATWGGVLTSDAALGTFTHHDVGGMQQYIADVLAVDAAGMQLLAAGDRIYDSADGGATWRANDVGSSPISFAKLSDGTLLAGTYHGLYAATSPAGPWSPRALSGIAVSRLLEANGAVIAATSAGVFISYDAAATFTALPGLEHANPHSLAVDASGRLYVGTIGYGLYYTDI